MNLVKKQTNKHKNKTNKKNPEMTEGSISELKD